LLLNYVARCPLAEPQVVLNEEAQAFRWVTLEEAWELDLNRPTQLLLEVYRNGLSMTAAGK
jgi:phosphoglycolate phosphatase